VGVKTRRERPKQRFCPLPRLSAGHLREAITAARAQARKEVGLGRGFTGQLVRPKLGGSASSGSKKTQV
jgi:hypothetical protein